jgi:hypothetical protein
MMMATIKIFTDQLSFGRGTVIPMGDRNRKAGKSEEGPVDVVSLLYFLFSCFPDSFFSLGNKR